MDILNPKSLRQQAKYSLRRGREPKKLIFSFAGLNLAISVAIFLANLWLDAEISGTGGLSNLGTRAVFATIQQSLPLISSVIAMCLDLGFLGGLMRISRGQYADHTDLKIGFHKFWPLVRLVLLSMTLYLSIAFPALLLGGSIFVDIVLMVILISFFYRIRMAFFCLLDDPNGRALDAVRESSRMMRGRFGQMLKLDLSLWLYYASTVLVSVVLYADLILLLLEIPFPVEAEIFSVLIYAAAILIQFAVQAWIRPTAEMTYLAAYDALREKPKDSGVVLGNIFDM